MTGFEPATFRLEVWRAIQLRHTDKETRWVHGVGFEPTKRKALDLKSNPVDQAWVSMLNYNEKYFFSRVV